MDEDGNLIESWFLFVYNKPYFFYILVDDFRLFCGDLGNEVTDEVSKWDLIGYSVCPPNS